MGLGDPAPDAGPQALDVDLADGPTAHRDGQAAVSAERILTTTSDTAGPFFERTSLPHRALPLAAGMMVSTGPGLAADPAAHMIELHRAATLTFGSAAGSLAGKPQLLRRVVMPWGDQFIFANGPAEAIEGSAPSGGAAVLDKQTVMLDKQHVQVQIGGVKPARSPQVVRAPIGLAARPIGSVELSGGPDLSAKAVAATQHAFGMAALVAALLGVMVGLVVSRGLTAPLEDLAGAARRMGGGDLSTRAPTAGPAELGELARQFNQMAERLEQSFRDLAADRDALRHFIADASHELRTPITSLNSFNTLLMTSAAGDAAATREFLAESGAQIERLEWITHNLLDLSRLEAGLVALDRAPLDAGELLADAAAAMRSAAEARGTEIVVRPWAGAAVLPEDLLTPPLSEARTLPLTAYADRGRLQLALTNLVDNALKFAPPGGRVTLGAEAGDGTPGGSGAGAADGLAAGVSTDPVARQWVRFWVEDDGPGIDPADRPRIFERFYRGANAVRAGLPGSGLGLAIVHGVAQAHGGRVWVEPGAGGAGSRFVIEV